MIRTPYQTKLYDIRKRDGYEGYNSFCNGTIFCPRDMKVVGESGNQRCVKMNATEIKQQSPPLIKYKK